MRKQTQTNEGLTEQVRTAAHELMVFTLDQIQQAVNVYTFKDARRLRGALEYMQRRGEVTTLAPHVYQYAPDKAPGQAEKASRVFRAMHVKGTFCCNQVVLLTDASVPYVHAMIQRLMDEGDLEHVGKIKGNGKVEHYYRVRHKDKFFMKHVYEGSQRKKQEASH